MARTDPFDRHAADYDHWFETNKVVYESELSAVRSLLPDYQEAIEVGVGTGRFAVPLGIRLGVEPSRAMGKLARARGVDVIEAVAEDLPFDDECFDLVLMVTTICFVDDLEKTLAEARRVLKEGAWLLIGFLDRGTELGRRYEERKSGSAFYRVARFRSSRELFHDLRRAGFRELEAVQTIFEEPSNMTEPAPVERGSGKGLFVVVRGRKH